MPLGMIDTRSIVWQDLPDFVQGDDFYHYNYDHRHFSLSSVDLKDSFLTGKKNHLGDIGQI